VKPSAAEKERRSEAGFLEGDRAARDAARKQHIAAALLAVRRSARISAQARARKRQLRVQLTDYAARRRERSAAIGELMREFDAAVAPLHAWFAKVENY
jgi:hypothetical protein